MPYYLPLLKDGLQQFLDDERIRRRHNGHGYDDWLVKYSDRRVSIAELMRYMNIKHYGTMASYIEQYEKEKQ